MELLKSIGYFVIFPGFLFTAAVGLLASWIDRKVTARVHWRKGPPILQPLYDIVKLMGKETIVPQGSSRLTFLLSPLFGLSATIIVSTLLWRTIISPSTTFLGDLIVVLYLLTIPSLAVIMGGFASRNPLASLGASREMKLILAYELPFILVALIPVIKAGTIRMGEILSYQLNHGIVIGSLSGIIGFLVAILCMQAKLALVPFDMAEAETEIMGGTYIEYSGAPLAIYKLTRAMMLFVVPMFLICIYCGGIDFAHGWLHILLGVLKYVGLLVVIILIRNTAPRVRIDQAMKFFWGPMTGLAVLGIVLALLGI
ncbi:NADH-quinone oxidoreductase subunit H [bacterium]|nr:NADH-quinone oxidoreductase subunit H [bacterium]MCK4436783.1 NADH-quinone oxidoreductase subunit H [bacterium]